MNKSDMKMKELLKKKNVVAVVKGRKIVAGVNTGREAIVIYVTEKIPLAQLSAKDIIPKTINGIESDVQVTSPIKALAFDRTKKWRPAPGGVSIGHSEVTAGTLGVVVKKKGVRHILSNNHVLANSNDASIYDETWQPGSHDGGSSKDTIGHLTDFIKINFLGDESTCPLARLHAWVFNGLAKLFHRKSRVSTYSTMLNTVDCAISLPVFDEDISDEILEIGKPVGFYLGELQEGEIVKKSGRTSRLNRGTVIGPGMVNVMYGDKIAVFEDQITTTPIAEGGDSGSVVLNEKNEVAGLLFAGSDTLTIVNKIANVIDALGLDKE
jgi:hypothetical protein